MPEGITDFNDRSEIEKEVIIEEVDEIYRDNYNLRKLTDTMEMDNLEGTVRMLDGHIEGNRKVGELEEAEISGTNYKEVHYSLWKNVSHVAISNEAQHRDTMGIHEIQIRDAGKDLARLENLDILDEITSEVETMSGNDWTDEANTDPTRDLMDAKNLIREADERGYVADTLVLHPDDYTNFILNDNIKGDFDLGSPERTQKQIANYVSLDIVQEDIVNKGEAYIMDTDAPAMVMFDGPQEAVEYDMGAQFGRGYAIAQYLQPKVYREDAIRKITGIDGT